MIHLNTFFVDFRIYNTNIVEVTIHILKKKLINTLFMHMGIIYIIMYKCLTHYYIQSFLT